MKKMVIAASIAAFLGCGAGYAANAQAPYTAAQREAINLLLKNGYHDVFITGQGKEQCTLVKSDFDFSAQLFEGVNKDGHIARGMVCNQKIYVRYITKTNDIDNSDSLA